MKHSDRTNKSMINRVRGSLIAGAAGDALGYAVEFMRLREIKKTYGENGITEYDLNPAFLPQSGKGFISDDTQMTLFTANGILMYDANHDNSLAYYVYLAYLDWINTQTIPRRLIPRRNKNYSHYTWLYEIPELHHRRAPGNTCIMALSSGEMGTIREPLNDSKGCGGVMRAAPVALRYIPEDENDFWRLDNYGADIAAITHGHDLGWLPAALLTHIIARVMQSCSLTDAINDAWKVNHDLFTGIVSERHFDQMKDLLDLAMNLAGSKNDDTDNIREIGEGWTGDETLAIALYCALRYEHDLSQALIASVNHDGDSDSTGAVTGNIAGAIVGYDGIADKWKDKLELKDVILELADDLCSDSWPEGKYKLKSYHIERFIEAQNNQEYGSYDSALDEIRNGYKRTHWIWYIFPQLKGLGHSHNAEFYGIQDINEAKLYLEHPVLGSRLHEISQALLNLDTNDPFNVMGSPDDMKLRSCMTLFAQVSENDSVFHKVLDKFFNGIQDEKTLQYLKV